MRQHDTTAVPSGTTLAGLSHEPRQSLEKDGWRCQIHTGSGRVWSRHGTDLSHAFSDVAQAARSLPGAVLDGELVAVLDTGEVAFERLQTRAGSGPRPGADFAIHVALFDILALGDTDLRRQSYDERRAELLQALQDGPATLQPVPSTNDVEVATDWVGALGGVEGVLWPGFAVDR